MRAWLWYGGYGDDGDVYERVDAGSHVKSNIQNQYLHGPKRVYLSSYSRTRGPTILWEILIRLRIQVRDEDGNTDGRFTRLAR